MIRKQYKTMLVIIFTFGLAGCSGSDNTYISYMMLCKNLYPSAVAIHVVPPKPLHWWQNSGNEFVICKVKQNSKYVVKKVWDITDIQDKKSAQQNKQDNDSLLTMAALTAAVNLGSRN